LKENNQEKEYILKAK